MSIAIAAAEAKAATSTRRHVPERQPLSITLRARTQADPTVSNDEDVTAEAALGVAFSLRILRSSGIWLQLQSVKDEAITRATRNSSVRPV